MKIMDKPPFLSVIIPTRNEEKFISMCLDSIILNDCPQCNLEVVVIDGMSDDRTREVVMGYGKRYSFIRLLHNPFRTTPAALNIGIRASSGDYVVILGGHSKIDKNYLKTAIKSIKNHNVECVGGVIKTLPAGGTAMARSIAIALAHPFGVGNAAFRIGSDKQKYVDTVAFGCYKREVFEKIGMFDEELIRNQDDEFNHRIIKSGGRILLVPEIVSYYQARDSLPKLWKMYYQYGYFKPLVAMKTGGVKTWRQLVPPSLILSIILSLSASFLFKPFIFVFITLLITYNIALLASSLFVAVRKGLHHFLILPVVFVSIHFGYGIGYINGLLDLVIARGRKTKVRDKNVPLTR